MTERLDRIEARPANPLDNKAGIEQLNQAMNLVVTELIRPNAQQIKSNARAIQATNEGIGELRNTVEAFIQKLDDEGLRVTLVTQMADDMGGDVSYLESEKNRQDASIVALRQDAIADRQAFREQAEADRRAFREALEADRAEWQSNFNAQMEAMRSQLVEMSRVNRRLDNLEQAS